METFFVTKVSIEKLAFFWMSGLKKISGLRPNLIPSHSFVDTYIFKYPNRFNAFFL
jgi:hypothetical protein